MNISGIPHFFLRRASDFRSPILFDAGFLLRVYLYLVERDSSPQTAASEASFEGSHHLPSPEMTDLSDSSRFVIPSYKLDTFGISKFETSEDGDGFYGV